MSDPIIDILEQENISPNDKVAKMCETIMSRHKERVLGFLYYGSSLRQMNEGGKMLDFYVLVDSYRKTHKNPIRAALNSAIPPCLLYTSPSPRDRTRSRMPSSA